MNLEQEQRVQRLLDRVMEPPALIERVTEPVMLTEEEIARLQQDVGEAAEQLTRLCFLRLMTDYWGPIQKWKVR